MRTWLTSFVQKEVRVKHASWHRKVFWLNTMSKLALFVKRKGWESSRLVGNLTSLSPDAKFDSQCTRVYVPELTNLCVARLTGCVSPHVPVPVPVLVPTLTRRVSTQPCNTCSLLRFISCNGIKWFMKLQLFAGSFSAQWPRCHIQGDNINWGSHRWEQFKQNVADISSEPVQYVPKSCLALGHLLRCAGNSD